MGTIVFGELIYVRPGQRLEDIEDLDADPFEQIVAREAAAELRRALKGLPAAEKQVIAWRYGLGHGEELSIRSIARRLGCSAAHVHALENRAVIRLRATYDAERTRTATTRPASRYPVALVPEWIAA